MLSNTNASSIATSFITALFIFPLCKFFEDQAQFPVGFVTRPVTGYEAQHHAGHHEHRRHNQDDLYHISVPCILPSTMLIAMAEMNMPAMMYTKSI